MKKKRGSARPSVVGRKKVIRKASKKPKIKKKSKVVKKKVVKKAKPKVAKKKAVKKEGFLDFIGLGKDKPVKKKGKKITKKPKVKIKVKTAKIRALKKKIKLVKKPKIRKAVKIKPVKIKKLSKKAIKKSDKQASKKFKTKATKEEQPVFIHTGIKGFDSMFAKGKGIPFGAAVLVEGGPGSGKTLFCLQTLINLCKQGKKGLYMSFEEPESRLIKHMESFGWNPKDYIKKGTLRVKRFDAIDISRSIEALLSAAKKELLIEVDPVFFPEDYDPDFVVIDSLTSIASAFSGQESRFRVYMEQLFRYLERNKITNFLVREVSNPSHVGSTFTEQGQAVSFLSDGIIVIYNVIYKTGKRTPAIEILKMRGSAFDKRIVEMQIIDKKGVEVYPNKILSEDKHGFNLT